jgi:hypothetical protein
MKRRRPITFLASAALIPLTAVAAVLLILALTGAHRRASGPFAWLKPTSPPAAWKVARTPGGATLPYPPGWTPLKTDPGTASFALVGSGGQIEAYLNATPRQGAETLANWTRFRPQHNGDEGDRDVRLVAATAAARFRSGRGACVIDTYATSEADYREIACLVTGPRSSAVVVAAAPIALWNQQAATLERAVSSFVA